MTGRSFAVNPCIGDALHPQGYRSKITPHFRRPPHLPDTPIGFQKAATRAIIDVPQCPIASEAINTELRLQRDRLGRTPGLYKKGGTLLLRDSLDGVITDMKAVCREQVGRFTFEFVAGEFFQNNPHVLPLMVNYALDQAAAPGIEHLVDAYCGVGVFGICGHDRFTTVTGIEVSERAIELAQGNAERNGAGNVHLQAGSAEAIFAELTAPAAATTVLIDPPRKGCNEDFIRQLIDYAPRRIVYVSCGPDTQARDLVPLLEAGYAVVEVQPFDLFPQTRHIENVVVLGFRG
jgi:tRNA/tmRNA/rRNA uracil-C5-methylase (TrmA/RlmC/RlmD family)